MNLASVFLAWAAYLIRERTAWTLPQLALLPETSHITRHICVEGWSAIGKWGGVRFADFLKYIGADTTAKYVGFRCDDNCQHQYRYGRRDAQTLLT